MFMIQIAGVKVLYTGDFSRIEDRHLMAAEVPTMAPDVLITVGSIPKGLGRKGISLGKQGKWVFLGLLWSSPEGGYIFANSFLDW